MKKAVGFDDEHHPARPLRPFRFTHDAPMIICCRRGSANGKSAEAMLADDARRGAVERGAVERSPESELVTSAEWSIGLVIGAYVVAIAPGRCAIACMKFGTHFGG